jgi:hypothetical protein
MEAKYVLSSKGSPTVIPAEVVRYRKAIQMNWCLSMDKVNQQLNAIQEAAIKNEIYSNI